MTKRSAVYLAGPMEDVSKEQMNGWRETATNFLMHAGIDVLDPCRRGIWHEHFDDPNVRSRIVQQDLQDLSHSRVILANFQGGGRGLGTMAEMSLAQRDRRAVITVLDKGAFLHPFIFHFSTEVHYDLNKALESVVTYFD